MNCTDCNFYQPIRTAVRLPVNGHFGECRRSPPRVVDAPSSRHAQTLAVFPVVSETDWCGEFVSWPAPLGSRAEDEANAAFDAATDDDATDGVVVAAGYECQCGRETQSAGKA